MPLKTKKLKKFDPIKYEYKFFHSKLSTQILHLQIQVFKRICLISIIYIYIISNRFLYIYIYIYIYV